ncbi:hypothetical protein EV714DRAFT_275088 [Schizophyllum commune]
MADAIAHCKVSYYARPDSDKVQWRVPIICARIRVRTCTKQQTYHVCVLVVRSELKRSGPADFANRVSIDGRPALEEKASDLELVVPRGVVKGSPAPPSVGSHVGATAEEKARDGTVAAFRCEVEGCPTIVQGDGNIRSSGDKQLDDLDMAKARRGIWRHSSAEKKTHDRRVTISCGDVKGCPAAIDRNVRVSVGLEKYSGDLFVPTAGGTMERHRSADGNFLADGIAFSWPAISQ